MTDREKVKKGLECCKASTNDDPFQGCSECPYNYISISVQDCRAVLSADALELLKEQEAVKPEREHSGGGTTWWNVCGNCKTAINPNDKFCHECGKSILWEGR